jgi:hypothetical protein
MKKESKQFIAVAVFLAGAIGVSAEEISVNFNSYTAPSVLLEGTSSGTLVNKRVVLQDSAEAGKFTAWGSASGTEGTYSVKVLGDNTGSNYLNLNSVKGSVGYNLMAQVSTTAAMPLSEKWSIKTRFSATAGEGSMYFGLYAGKKMTPQGGYEFGWLVVGNTNVAAVALGLSVTQSGKALVTRTAVNNKLEFWNGSKWVPRGADAFAATGIDVTGKKQYDLELSTDGTTMKIILTDVQTSEPVISLDSLISELGSNITRGNMVRFSGGDIANNSTDGWNMKLHTLSLQ